MSWEVNVICGIVACNYRREERRRPSAIYRAIEEFEKEYGSDHEQIVADCTYIAPVKKTMKQLREENERLIKRFAEIDAAVESTQAPRT